MDTIYGSFNITIRLSITARVSSRPILLSYSSLEIKLNVSESNCCFGNCGNEIMLKVLFPWAILFLYSFVKAKTFFTNSFVFSDSISPGEIKESQIVFLSVPFKILYHCIVRP